MASIKDIAKLCGVSVATVSKALNDKADISEDTKQHIKQVAKQMGYVPQYYARAIRTNKSYNIGVLFMDDANCGLTHDYFSSILNSFKVTAEAPNTTSASATTPQISRSGQSMRSLGYIGTVSWKSICKKRKIPKLELKLKNC